MKKQQPTFASLLGEQAYRHDLRPLFDDFLTLTLCAFSQNPRTGKSFDEDLYMETIGKYDKELARELFPKLLASLIMEMEERKDSSEGNDVLGGFYEQHIYRKGAAQYFTPWPVCQFMAQCLGIRSDGSEPRRILDPTCGSGRTLMAAAKVFGPDDYYFGIDIDHMCVKMTALNLFLNGVFHGDIMCADALNPDDFRVSYQLSFLPFGIFRHQDKEHSPLWHMHRNSFPRKEQPIKPEVKLPSETGEMPDRTMAQLSLF